MKNRAFVLIALLGSFAFATPAFGANDTFIDSVKKHALEAKQSGDVQGLVQAAFALYPIEIRLDPSQAQYTELLNQAVDLTIARKNVDAAAELLEAIGPLSARVEPDRLDALETLARGKTAIEAIRTSVDAQVARTTSRYGVRFGDPNNTVQVRGEAEEAVADAISMAIVAFMRPSVVVADREPRMLSHSWSSPKRARKRLESRVQYFGAMTGDPYVATIQVDFLVSEGIEILRIGYSDDNLLPTYNLRKVGELIDMLNRALGN